MTLRFEPRPTACLGETVDGMSVSAVYDAVSRAADRARSGHGPTFLEMKTYRYCGHMPGDSEIYRSADEVTEWRARDPRKLAAAIYSPAA